MESYCTWTGYKLSEPELVFVTHLKEHNWLMPEMKRRKGIESDVVIDDVCD